MMKKSTLLFLGMLVANTSCASGMGTDPAASVYEGIKEASLLSIRDFGEVIQVQSGRGEMTSMVAVLRGENWRCSLVAAINICAGSNSGRNQPIMLPDGGVLTIQKLAGGAHQNVVAYSQGGARSCDYSVWSASNGIQEFGTIDCARTDQRQPVWRLVDGPGLFAGSHTRQ